MARVLEVEVEVPPYVKVNSRGEFAAPRTGGMLHIFSEGDDFNAAKAGLMALSNAVKQAANDLKP